MCDRIIDCWAGGESGPNCEDCRTPSQVNAVLKQNAGFVRLTINLAPVWRALGHGSPPEWEGRAVCPSCAAKRLATQGEPAAFSPDNGPLMRAQSPVGT
jgi:hypothetical protein